MSIDVNAGPGSQLRTPPRVTNWWPLISRHAVVSRQPEPLRGELREVAAAIPLAGDVGERLHPAGVPVLELVAREACPLAQLADRVPDERVDVGDVVQRGGAGAGLDAPGARGRGGHPAERLRRRGMTLRSMYHVSKPQR
jgi:hypothetical protein